MLRTCRHIVKHCPGRRKMSDNPSLTERLERLKGGHVDLDIRGNVAFVRFNNASHRNAMTGAMMSDFEKIVNLEIPQYDGKAIVLTGEAHGKAFCAGSDFECLEEFSEPEDAFEFSSLMHSLTSQIYFNEKFLTISFLNGAAFGGGAELATCTDMRLASPNAKLSFVHKNMALQPGWGGATRLTRLVGLQNSLYMLSTGKVFEADELIKTGFCAPEVVKDIDVWLEKNLLNIPKPVIRAMKKNGVNALKYDYDKAMSKEREIFATLVGSEENRHALKMALSKMKNRS